MPANQLKLDVQDLLGVFYQQNGETWVAEETEGTIEVAEILQKFEGHQIRLLAHHQPRKPIQKELWGGGCCLYQKQGECPFGHHKSPSNLFKMDRQGKLTYESAQWALDGSMIQPWLDQLVGHRSQLVLTTFPDKGDLEQRIKDLDPSNLNPADLQGLVGRVQDLQGLLEELQKIGKDPL